MEPNALHDIFAMLSMFTVLLLKLATGSKLFLELTIIGSKSMS